MAFLILLSKSEKTKQVVAFFNMTIWYIVAGLIVVSFLWALWSLRGVLKNHKELEVAQKELLKGRVVYQNESSTSS